MKKPVLVVLSFFRCTAVADNIPLQLDVTATSEQHAITTVAGWLGVGTEVVSAVKVNPFQAYVRN